MRKVEQAEELADMSYMFEPPSGGPVTAASNTTLTFDNSISTNLLDGFVIGLKWTFLYVPAALWVHMMFTVVAMLLPDVDVLEMLPQLLGGGLIATFLMTFGIGQASNLKYLRVAGTVFATAGVLAVVSTIFRAFIPNFYEVFIFLSMPVTVLSGYLAKRNTDRLPS